MAIGLAGFGRADPGFIFFAPDAKLHYLGSGLVRHEIRRSIPC